MTRKDVEENYRVVDGVIRSPGKFEGEAWYAPVFYEYVLDGMVDEDDDDGVAWFDLDVDDYAMAEELKGYRRLSLLEDDNGFVYVRLHESNDCAKTAKGEAGE